MATLLLSAAGSAAGGVLGGPLGAAIGQAVGAAVGAAVDRAVIGAIAGPQKTKGPRLTSVDITASTEGAAIARLIGRSRLSGQMIWATRFEEEASTTSTGGKGLGGASAKSKTYNYFANFAVALGEGPVERIGRIWMDGREADQTAITVRKYLGSEAQTADSLVVAKEGDAPAYRGVAYLVFERLALAEYGNRMPVVTAEVFRSVGAVEPLIEGVALIPGTTEFGYDPDEVVRKTGKGAFEPENRHTKVAASDLMASLDLLEDLAPNCGTVSLVAAWFGDDLRCGACTIRPKVENAAKTTRKGKQDYPWIAAGLTRATAQVVSQVAGGPAFGGAPNDASLIKAIGELKARGFTVIFYPFVMMDVPAGNTLPDPYSDNAATEGQPAYPWRGRITCSPAPGFAGSPDKTAAAATQVAAFVGAAAAADFSSSSGTTVTYTGPAEWSYRRFILHMAKICELAGGVDYFCIGSEMRGLTTVRDSATTYPFVAALIDLAAEVRTMLPAARIGYAADWSEYHSHRPGDGSNDVLFNLDPLWADANIDFVGIDNYLPLSDWRDGTDHLDYDPAGPTVIYDLDYLKGNVEGGEYYDYFYPAAGATGNEPSPERIAQDRTPIVDTDPAAEHWVFRQKDLKNWWLNAHHDRPGGVRSGTPTAWTPESKPIIFTELGCPAIDKGPNQPNVFVDPKSSESFAPYFSTGARDDAAQRAFLAAVIGYWNDAANNPQSGLYAGRMIETARTCVWAWDARMAPSFPDDEKTWADAPNWETGHWVSGRLGSAPANEAIAALMDGYGFSDYAVEPIGAVVDAVIIDRVMSARAVFDAVAPAFLAYAVEAQGLVRFRSRLAAPVQVDLSLDNLAAPGSGPGAGSGERFTRTRAQESELPAVVKLSYGEPTADDLAGAVEARRLAGTVGSDRTLDVSLPVVMPESRARAIAEVMLHDAWTGRETLEAALPPSLLALDPGDIVRLDLGGAPETFRLDELADGEARRARFTRTLASLYGGVAGPRRARPSGGAVVTGEPEVIFLDGALLRDTDDDWAGYLAAYVSPWPGGLAAYRSPTTAGFVLDQVLDFPARLGELAFDFYSGPAWRFDEVNALFVDIVGGTLASATEIAVLGGANAVAVENADGEWEIVQFVNAELVSAGRYKLSRLLRGQRGSEHAMRDPVAAGARVLVLDAAVVQPAIDPAETGLALVWRVGPAGRDVADDSYNEQTVTLAGKGRRPLAPVHVSAERDQSTGDLTIRWIRRTRIGGDSWDQDEVPLGEEAERYELEILDPGDDSLVRAVTGLPVPSYLYQAAEQTADFGSTVTSVRVRVAQVSAAFGRGIAALATAEAP